MESFYCIGYCLMCSYTAKSDGIVHENYVCTTYNVSWGKIIDTGEICRWLIRNIIIYLLMQKGHKELES